jgi:hypothetical protein
MTIQYDNLNSTISAVGTATNIPINIQPKGTGGVNVLGSGQNLLLRSQEFSNAVYVSSTATRTDNQTTAPDGTSTGALIQANATSFGGLVRQFNPTYVSNTTYTISVFAKAGTSNFVGLRPSGGCVAGGGADNYCYFNLSNGTATAITPLTGTVVSVGAINVGNGWYRCFVVYTTAAVSNSISDFAVVNSVGATGIVPAGTETIFAWGFQVELGNTLNTYIPTTFTTIYGTPTLTLSGVAGLGLQSDGSLYVQPAGTGAIQAQATTSTTAGGNARGANATDWQTLRNTAAKVASGPYSTISGGQQHTSSGAGAFVGGGYQHSCTAYEGTIVGGSSNSTNSFQSFIGGGSSNTANGALSVISGGGTNTAAGLYNFIGGGQTNSGTSGSAVTTQSATMNGTTAVTLSGSNANIKVGQAITGNFITYPNTYVAAISGTSLTLSAVASGSGTATLSFYTPHGIVVGGGNNQATGSYSFIGGGGDAGTAGNRNVASGDWSVVAGGWKNTASNFGSFVGGGGANGGSTAYGNTASGITSCVVGGLNNNASGTTSFIGSGTDNIANATNSAVLFGVRGTTRGIIGNTVTSPSNAPIASASGVQQTGLLILGRQTTDATPTALTSDTSAAGTTNQVILPNNSAYFFTGEVISGVTGGGNTKGWTIEGVIKRGANAASTALVGTPTVSSLYGDAGAATWTIAVTADTTNGGLAVTFTGQAATTIRTVAQIRTTEMTY